MGLLAVAGVVAACGGSGGVQRTVATSFPSGFPHRLVVVAGNSTLVVGVNQIGVELFDELERPVMAAHVTVDIQGTPGGVESRPLVAVASEYGSVSAYVGVARFPRAGQYRYTVHVTLGAGTRVTSGTDIRVVSSGPELPIGARVPPLRQPIATNPGVRISDVDSGVPPDPWHTATIADGLAQHRPMVLYFGDPALCAACGPTVKVLEQLATKYGDQLLFEHIEDDYPAGAAKETRKANPAFDAFGLQTDPWVYFVSGGGVISDRFEGPVSLSELQAAADGTLAGRIPAVDVAAG
jgi:hypothetical protein